MKYQGNFATILTYAVCVWAWVCCGTAVAQRPIPASSAAAVVWLEEEDNSVDTDEYGRVVEVVIDYVPDIFVVGDLDIFPHLESLKINSARSFFDHHMSGIARLKNLKSLSIRRCDELTEATLAVLRYLPKLESVTLIDCDSIYSLAPLNGCLQLKHLHFSKNPQFDFDEFERLGFLGQLESLTITECPSLKDKHFEYIARAAELRKLQITDCHEVTDRGFAALANLSRLTELIVGRNPKLTGDFFASVPDQLVKLELLRGSFNRECVTHFGRLTKLEQLTVANAFESPPSDWSSLRNCKQLTTLVLPNTEIADEHLQQMKGLVDLEMVNFNDCPNISGRGLTALSGATKLKTLRLRNCRRIDSEDLPVIANFTNLVYLDLFNTQIGPTNMESLSGLKKLETLILDDCKRLDDDAMEAISSLPNLQMLFVSRISRLTDKSLTSFAKLKNLKLLSMGWNQKITGEGFASFGPDSPLERLEMIQFEALTPAGLANLMEMKSLVQLRFHSNNLSNEHVLALKGHPRLVFVDFGDIKTIDSRVLLRLKNSLPNGQ